MLRLFQPGVLFVLVCAFFLGMFLPLNFDKPRFLTPTKKGNLEGYNKQQNKNFNWSEVSFTFAIQKTWNYNRR